MFFRATTLSALLVAITTLAQVDSITLPDEQAPTPVKVISEEQKPSELHITPLQPGDSTAHGGLVASTYPKHAKLYLNNIFIGVGEATLTNLEPGEYILMAKTEESSKTVEIVIKPGHFVHKEVALTRKTKVFISSAYGMTLFNNRNTDELQYAWGPMLEFGVSVREKLFIGFDFHWGLWSESLDSIGGVSTWGKSTAVGGKMKMCWQKMFLDDHIGILLGGGIGFYYTDAREASDSSSSGWYDYDYTFTGGYFGGPSVTAMFGGPIAYGTIGYDMYWGTGIAHQFKMGIAAYF